MVNYDWQNHPPLVLVVDDERALRLVLHRAMEKEGYRVTQACNGQHCLDLCQERLPDLILLDAMMPGLDGFSCCSQMLTLWGDNCPPILMITALDDQESVDKAFAAGATDYITKPIDWPLLGQRVNRLLTSRWAIAELQQKIQRECIITAQVEAANRELQRLASVDNLTKIANRYYFDEYIQREWNRLQKYQLSLSLILLNINFTQDDADNQTRNEYLSQIANIVRQCKQRGADLVARFGDVEFAMLLPNSPTETAVQVAKRILSNVQAVNLADDFTCNICLATVVPNSELSVNQFIAKAKKALLQAKFTDSDRIVILS